MVQFDHLRNLPFISLDAKVECLMTPLLDPINNLRRFLYSFSTDIEAFFHNIAVEERDCGVFRFLWYKDEAMEVLKTYIMLFMVFGSSSSPSITSYVLKIHGKRIREKFGEEIYLIITSTGGT